MGLGFFYFILNMTPLNRDVAWSGLYLDGKTMRRQCQTNILFRQQYLEKSESKHCLHKYIRVFDKLSNDMQVDRLCTCGSLVIDVSFAELLESQKFSF